MESPSQLLHVLATSTTITRLNLRKSMLDDGQLACLASMTQLQELVLPERVSDEGLQYISSLRNLRLLEQARGYDKKAWNAKLITDAGLHLLSGLRHLETLSLPYTDTSDDGLQHIRHFPRLKILALGSEGVTDKGMSHLSCLGHLRELSVSRTSVGDAGVAILAKSHPNLEHLNLCHTSVTSACVSDLSKLTRLRWLGVYDTPLNGRYPSKSRATCKLERLLPDCEVMWID